MRLISCGIYMACVIEYSRITKEPYMTHTELFIKYPPSKGCSCSICRNFCRRPGWWSVEQARIAMEKGYGSRMMMEISPEFTFAVLSPAFFGNEGRIARNENAGHSCNFFASGLCELHNSDLLPLECAFCHHERIGLGQKCHNDIESNWNTQRGQALVLRWCEKMTYTEGMIWARYFYEMQNRR